MPEIKAITLTQPWASLIALGVKRIETRSWSTAYRGPLAIHAAKGLPKGMDRDVPYRFGEFEVTRDRSGLLLRGPLLAWPYRLPVGAIVAVCRLTNVISTDDPDCVPGSDEPYGDYSPGRYAWYLDSVEPIRRPIPATGKLSLWPWDLTDESVGAL